MCQLNRNARASANAQSPALVLPRSVDGLDVEPHPGWTRAEQSKIDAYVGQLGLFDKYLADLCGPSREVTFYVGNQAKRAHVFSVLGVYWPPRR